MEPTKFSYIPPDQLQQIWPRISLWIQEVADLTSGRSTPLEVLDRALNGQCEIWLAYEETSLRPLGAAVTRISQYPDVKLLTVEMLAGDKFHRWERDAHSAFEIFAKHNHCNGMECWGRRGWVRQLSKFGWRESFTTAQVLFEEEF